jgi:hypothetical protein
VIEGRAAPFRAVRAWHGALEIGTEQLEIHHRIQPFQAVALAESCFSRSSMSKNPA